MDFKTAAINYEPPKLKTVCELEAFSISADLQAKEGLDNKTNKPYNYYVLNLAGEDYKVPGPVLNQIKEILKLKPDAKTFKASKQGTGFQTRYTVVVLE